MIVHRLPTIRHAVQIVVLEGTGIAELGTHERFMAKNGIYFDIRQSLENTEGHKY